MVLAHDITKGERTRDVKITENITFETMLLAPNTLQGLKDAGFYKPSPIQLYGIPIGKCGFDLLLEAKSGTGKTAVFSIIALEQLDLSKGLQVVILTPTREIAAQIYDVTLQIGSRYKELRVEVVMGGLPYQDDVQKFQKIVHIVVGSPGRLKHLIQHNIIDTSSVRLFVLDEADKLMEKPFQPDVKFIHTVLPQQKQVIMSSATFSDSAKTFINNYVQNANHICPDSDSVLLGITQKVCFVKYNNNIVRQIQDRFKELLQILVQIQFKQCLVFCNYQARVTEVHKKLKKEKWPSQQLSGHLGQVDRLDALKTLQQYKCRILVSTDLAARGIDASNIDLVVNFEPPYEWQTYLHRIGRAGRYGSYGLAVTILSKGKEEQIFRDMFKSMESSIKMHNLWDDKEFCLDCSNASTKSTEFSTETFTPTINFYEEVSHEDMWKVLSSQSNVINSIETFEDLCKSQENLCSDKIETYSNLEPMAKKLENLRKETFKHLEMKKISSIILPKEESNNLPNDISKYTNLYENAIKSDDNSDTTKKRFDKGVEKNGDNKETLSKNLKEVMPTDSNSHNMEGNTNTKTLIAINSLEHDSCINKSLLELDLPTMFSNPKMKFSKMQIEKNNKVTTNKPVVSYSGKLNETSQLLSNKEIFKDKQDFNNFDDINISHSKKSSKIRNSHRTETVKPEKETYTYEKELSSGYSRDDEYIQNYARCHQRKGKKEKYNREKSYIAWYNQLKFNTNQIEQAIYIEEMSRI